MHLRVLILVFSAVASRSVNAGITFKNVTFSAYGVDDLLTRKTIESGAKITDYLPEKNINTIVINDQEIPTLYEGAFSDIEFLGVLELESNGIEEVKPGAFANLPSLRSLSLGNNKIKLVSKGVFNNLPVSTLTLSNNSISAIDPEAFNDLPNLYSLKLDGNSIKEINPNWFINTPALTILRLQRNQLTHVPKDAFQNLKQVDKRRSPPSILLSENKIKTIDRDAFAKNEALKYVWLDSNELTSLQDEVFAHTKIEELRINDNKFTCIGNYEKIFVAAITVIYDNPWDCDCLEEMKKWSEKNGKSVRLDSSVTDCLIQSVDRKLKDTQRRFKEGNNFIRY